MLSKLQNLKKFNFTNIMYFILLLVLTCIVYYYNAKDLQLKIAYKGWGPQDYVNHKLYPENFKKDWPNGIMAYDNSLPMKFYYYLAKYFHFNPTKIMYPHMFLQTLLFVFSVTFLVQNLFNSKVISLLCVIITLCSPMCGINLSRFGYGFNTYLKWPLYYGFANAFRIFAFGFALRNEYIYSFLFLALSIYCHLTMGLLGLIFIGAYFLYKPRKILNKFTLLGICIFFILIIPYMLSIVSNITTSSGTVPVDQWVKSTRIFSYHWYPITMKRFTENAHKEFFPILLLCFFFLISLKKYHNKEEKNTKIIAGSLACALTSVVGIFFSDIYPTPVLIKISPQRASSLITFFGTLYIICYLYEKIRYGNILAIFLSVYSLFIFVSSEPGIAFLPLFFLIYTDVKNTHSAIFLKILYYIIGFSIFLATILSITISTYKTGVLHSISYNLFNNLWTPLQKFNPAQKFDFLIRGGKLRYGITLTFSLLCSIFFTITVYLLKNIKNNITKTLLRSVLFISTIICFWYLERNIFLKWHKKFAEIAKSYLQVQLWAQKNTPLDALFMYDPSYGYGWRDFSKGVALESYTNGDTQLLHITQIGSYILKE
ncbi:MAG: hypothetical protein DRP29_07145 [Thermodesulfobacteriota bacterium]|nr:MAG: hypothetical protein DRP29_07145 [Thermodesulfobacteriota bacterium]